jgi:alkanesulfonate monooxygenase SsuD/methylene tetrahydromethanopterin reductase-like flavin-dependent oxidoreductase (luciferase family)
MLKTVAEVGDGWNLGDDPTVDVYKEKLAVVNQACKELGRDPNSVMKTWDGHVIVRKNPREFEELVTSLKKHKATDKIGTTQLIPSNIFEDCIAGTPDTCIEKIKKLAALGISHFSLWFLDYPSFDGIKVFAEQVIPAFR